MSTVLSLEPRLDVDAVLAGQGCDAHMPASRRARLVEAAQRALAAGPDLVTPRLVFDAARVTAFGRDEVHLAGGRLRGEAPWLRLRGATRIVATVATLGPRLETEVSRLMDADPLLALALDGYGTAALNDMVHNVCGRFRDEALSAGERTTPPLSPGMDGWPLAQGQRELFSVVDASAIGVALTESSLMLPRKSISVVVGIGAEVEQSGRQCDWCSMRERCRFRCQD